MADSYSSAADSDSDMLSSSEHSTACSSEADDSPLPSARGGGGGAGGSGAQPRAPPPRVPPLSLRLSLAALPRDDSDTPRTSRQQQPPPAMPRLALPLRVPTAGGVGQQQPQQQQQQAEQSAAPAASTRSASAPPPPLPPALRLSRPTPPPLPRLPLPAQAPAPATSPAEPAEPASQAGLLSLEILSPAFTLDKQQQTGQGCATRLGVPPDRLKYYALTEVAGPQQLPAGCRRAAVEVLDSRFSLSALEELLAENQRLAAAQAQAQQQAAAPPLREQQGSGNSGAAAAAQVAQLQAALAELRVENEGLRQKLRKSEGLRLKGQKALYELKQEFTALSHDLMLGQESGLGLGLEFAMQQCSRVKPVGTPAAVADALL